MPHYRFHLAAPECWYEDEEGLNLPDIETAEAKAVKAARSLVAEDAKAGVVSLNQSIEVHGVEGCILVLPFADVVKVFR